MTRKPRSLKLARRFARDEDGAVMILTVLLMMLMVKVCFSTFNVGVLTAERMRLQMVADTAAYSSAVWQARFLNYCAYTRRAIIANYANAALFTAMESNKPLWDHYDEMEPNSTMGCPIPYVGWKIDPDNWPLPTPTTRGSMKVFGGMYDFTTGQWSDDKKAREVAEALAKMHAKSQEVMYAFISRYWLTVVPEIVEASNASVGGRNLVPIKIDDKYLQWASKKYKDNATGMLNESFIRQVDLTTLKEDIEKRYDSFTDPKKPNTIAEMVPAFIGQNSLPFFVSRPFWGFDMFFSHLTTYPSSCTVTIYPCINPDDAPMVTRFMSNSEVMTTKIESSSGEFKTKDYRHLLNAVFNQYFAGWQWAWTPWTGFFCVPVYGTIYIFGWTKEWSATYEFKNKPSNIKFYDLKENLPLSQHEPSVYVVLRIDRADLVGPGTGMWSGKLFHNQGIPLGNQVKDLQAVSRAKVYFQPRWTQQYYEPNLYYPYWEAKLAPMFGPGYDNANSVLRNNGLSLLSDTMPSGVGTAAYARNIHY